MAVKIDNLTSIQERMAGIAANGRHTGLCMGTYIYLDCDDCPCELECVKLFMKEREKLL